MAEEKKLISYNNAVKELLESEKTFLEELKSLIDILQLLRKYTQLPQELYLRIYLDELLLEYSQLLSILQQSSLNYLVRVTDLNNFESQPIIDELEKAFIPSDEFNPKELNTITEVLGYIANNHGYFSSPLDRFTPQIEIIQKRILGSKNTADKKQIADINRTTTVIDSITNGLIAPVQRIGRYELLFNKIYEYKPSNKTSDEQKQNNQPQQKMTAIQKSIVATNKNLTPSDKKLQWIPSKRSMWDMISKQNRTTKAGQKADSLHQQNEKNQKQAKQSILNTLKIVNSWLSNSADFQLYEEDFSVPYTPRKLRTPTVYHLAEKLRNRLYESYFLLKMPSNENIQAIIKTHIDMIANHDPECDLIIALSNPKEFKSEEDGMTFKLSGENENIRLSNEEIYFPIIDTVLQLSKHFRDFNSGKYWHKPLSLDSDFFDTLISNINSFKSKLQDTPIPREEFCLALIKIFRDSLQCSGIFPRHLLRGKFGNFLREIASYIDRFKPTAYRPALELMTSPEGYNPAPRITKLTTKKTYSPLVLCTNIQRILDFYSDNDLGLLVAENIPNGDKKHSSNRRWMNKIKILDQKITKIYLLAQKTSSSPQETHTSMLKEICATISDITSKWWLGGSNSAAAGTLYTLANEFIKYIKKTDAAFKLEEFDLLKNTGNSLAEGVITFDSDFDYENYFFKHVAQRTSESFVRYFDTAAERIKTTTASKVTHTKKILNVLNQVYINPFMALSDPALEEKPQSSSSFSSPAFSQTKTSKRIKQSPQPAAHSEESRGSNSKNSTPSKFPGMKEYSIDQDINMEQVVNCSQKSNASIAINNFWKIKQEFLPNNKENLNFDLCDQHGKAFKDAQQYLTDIGLEDTSLGMS
jgi:hypothetical protein